MLSIFEFWSLWTMIKAFMLLTGIQISSDKFFLYELKNKHLMIVVVTSIHYYDKILDHLLLLLFNLFIYSSIQP
ncbi:hypothetical protein DERP_001439 [Dermatophagoides pteronyssinus]|uniref:Uncharacterized protein n=1 Tax=Dermatophagoides pteronyssinus TaxID=6956 RepID=A0ABQ8JEI0_DERPT|nr:hypothetical protein DERP_001439 [Dermatophagoides pteronyssinus]